MPIDRSIEPFIFLSFKTFEPVKPTLLILAAGMGSRYGGLKQVDAVGPAGETIIEYSIYDAINAGFGKVVFVIRKEIEAPFKEKIGNQFEGKIAIEYAFQEFDSPVEGITEFPERLKPWGTAHAVLVADAVINEPFAVINADDYYGIDGFKSMAEFLMNECTPHTQSMVGYVISNTLSDHGTVNRGVAAMDENHMLTAVHERLKIKRNAAGVIHYEGDDGLAYPLKDNDLVSMNFWGFHPSIFEEIRKDFVQFVHDNKDNPKAEFFIPLFVDTYINDGRIQVKVLVSEDHWYGVTYQEDKPIVQTAFAALVAAGRYPAPLWKKEKV